MRLRSLTLRGDSVLSQYKVLKIGRDNGERVLVLDSISGSRTWIMLSLFPAVRPKVGRIKLMSADGKWSSNTKMVHGQKLVMECPDSGSRLVITLLINGSKSTDQACLIFEAPESFRIWREEIVPKEQYDEIRRIANAERA